MMRPVNWNDPDLVGKYIKYKEQNIVLEITGVGETQVFVCPDNLGGCEYSIYKTDGYFYYEEPEENLKHNTGYHYFCASCYNFQVVDGDRINDKNHTCHDCGYNTWFEEDLLKGRVPEGKETASGLRDLKESNEGFLKCRGCGVSSSQARFLTPNYCEMCALLDRSCFDEDGKLKKKEPNRPKLLAPALIKADKRAAWHASIDEKLFSSEEEARSYYDRELICWPAPIPNKDGFYEVSDE